MTCIALLALGGCSTAGMPGGNFGPAPNAPAQVAITAMDLPGSWGLASFQRPEDRGRTEAEAKSACSNPYVIAAGGTGGAMMYLPDQTTPSEVFVKTAPDGRVYIGPQGVPGMQQDRLVLSFQNNMLVSDWVNPTARQNFGTMVLIRCGVA